MLSFRRIWGSCTVAIFTIGRQAGQANSGQTQHPSYCPSSSICYRWSPLQAAASYPIRNKCSRTASCQSPCWCVVPEIIHLSVHTSLPSRVHSARLSHSVLCPSVAHGDLPPTSTQPSGHERTLAHTLWAMLRDIVLVARGEERHSFVVAMGLAFFNQVGRKGSSTPLSPIRLNGHPLSSSSNRPQPPPPSSISPPACWFRSTVVTAASAAATRCSSRPRSQSPRRWVCWPGSSWLTALAAARC